MMKKWLIALLMACCMCISYAMAEGTAAPVLRMELSQTRFAEPQEITVTITVTNPSGEPMDPMALYYPNGKMIAEFGTPMLESGETRTWEGTWNVTEEQLDEGKVVFAIQYVGYEQDGSPVTKTQAYYVAVAWETKPSQTVEIVLKGNPSTGYSWDWQGISGDNCVDIQCASEVVDNDPVLVGGPIKYTYVVKGLRPGFVEICFTYARPWEHDPAMAIYQLYYDIYVDDELNVSILNTRFNW